MSARVTINLANLLRSKIPYSRGACVPPGICASLAYASTAMDQPAGHEHREEAPARSANPVSDPIAAPVTFLPNDAAFHFCPKCGYDLTPPAESGICSECGSSYARADLCNRPPPTKFSLLLRFGWPAFIVVIMTSITAFGTRSDPDGILWVMCVLFPGFIVMFLNGILQTLFLSRHHLSLAQARTGPRIQHVGTLAMTLFVFPGLLPDLTVGVCLLLVVFADVLIPRTPGRRSLTIRSISMVLEFLTQIHHPNRKLAANSALQRLRVVRCVCVPFASRPVCVHRVPVGQERRPTAIACSVVAWQPEPA